MIRKMDGAYHKRRAAAHRLMAAAALTADAKIAHAAMADSHSAAGSKLD